MATIVPKTVGTAARQYATWTLWEAGEQGDLVALDEIHQGQGYNDSVFDEGGELLIDGGVTDATRYMEMTAAPEEETQGRPNTGVRLQSAISFAGIILANQAGTKINKIEIVNTSAGTNSWGVRGSGLEVFEKCYLENQSLSILYTGKPGVTIRNSVCVANGGGAITLSASFPNTLIENVTLKGGNFNSEAGAATRTTKNCVLIGCDWTGIWSGNNNSGPSDSSPPGASGLTDVIAADFFDHANDDLRPVAGASFVGNGADLSGDFTDDLIGTTRSTPWDRGAFKLVAEPTAEQRRIFNNSFNRPFNKRFN